MFILASFLQNPAHAYSMSRVLLLGVYSVTCVDDHSSQHTAQWLWDPVCEWTSQGNKRKDRIIQLGVNE